MTGTQHAISLDSTGSNSAGLSPEAIAQLNEAYAPLDFEARIRRLYRDFVPQRIMVTSSFAATSAYFLHIISRIRPEQKIFFINTGFHFAKTLEYRDYLIKLFKLRVEDIRPDAHHFHYAQKERLYEADPDLCCAVNKVQPLEAVKEGFDVWVSSLMRWQTEHRAELRIFEERRGLVKFNPMIDVTREQRDAYIRDHNLPFHPLVAEGYASIGCSHCTVKGEGRSGRWQGRPKTECGLHL